MDHLSGDRKRAMEELLRGRRRTSQLLEVLGGRESSSSAAAAAEDLVAEIQKSFTEALAILDSSGSQEVSQPVHGKYGRSSSGLRRSEDSGESCKSPWKDRRGSYKRRKTAHSWTSTALTLVDDGYGWRKYGQKTILNTKHPRSYYRCTHKFDQGCLATKQVQMTEAEPAAYQITYNNHHTCKKSTRAPHIAIDSAAAPGSPCGEYSSRSTLSFDSPMHHHQQQQQPMMMTKQQLQDLPYGEEEMMIPDGGGNPGHHSYGGSCCYDRQSAALVDDQDDPIWSLLSSFEVSRKADVISRYTTAGTDDHLDMNMMVGYGDFMDDVLDWDVQISC